MVDDSEIVEIHKIPGDDSNLRDASLSSGTAASTRTARNRRARNTTGANVVQDEEEVASEPVGTEGGVAAAETSRTRKTARKNTTARRNAMASRGNATASHGNAVLPIKNVQDHEVPSEDGTAGVAATPAKKSSPASDAVARALRR